MVRTAAAIAISIQAALLLSAVDLPVVSAFQRADPAMRHVEILVRRAVSVGPDARGLDLVIALGGLQPPSVAPDSAFWWGAKQKLALYLQETACPERVYTLAVTPGFDDCFARIERATATDTVISCAGEKSEQHPNQKFVYDLRAKAMVGRVSYSPVPMYAAFALSVGAVFVGSDGRRLVAVEYRPAATPVFSIIGESEARPWAARMSTYTGTVGMDLQQVLYIEPQPFQPVRFGPAGEFTLVREPGDSLGPKLVIVERRGAKSVRHVLPRPAYDEFARVRPARVKDGYSRAGAELNDAIGPWKLEGDRLWFGKTFYDGEGCSGIGGFGYFDSVHGRFRLFAPPEIADWSVSAIAVESETVWLGLVRNGEWGGSGGGLLRFDRVSERVAGTLKLAGIAGAFVRVGDRLAVATSFGIEVIEGDRLRRYFVDRATDGRLRVAEAGH